MTLRIIPAIMSGGAGTRLWPLSTEDHPKQFHALMGPRTMFADTVARMSGAVGGIEFAPPIVLCGDKHVPRVRSALAETGASAAAIVIEPAARNTAAVAASAAAVAREIDRDALVLLAPSDHVVKNVAAFHDAVARAARLARERIVTFGMTPTYAATGYGYIRSGGEIGDHVFAIESFKEKPNAQTAEAYLRDGGYFWNGGMFLFAPETLLAEFGAHAAIRDRVLEALKHAARDDDLIWLGPDYAAAPAVQLDVAVMERTSLGAVAPCDIGWADIGSWAEVWRLAPRDADGFALLGAAVSADASKMIASGVKAVAIDGDGLVVVANSDGLLIAPRALVRNRAEITRAVQGLRCSHGWEDGARDPR
jgi:mannose-1-phosphate guanylyltransferase/mannose-6-phosphate isomerase